MTPPETDAAKPGAGQDSSQAFSLQVIIGLVIVGVITFAAFIVLSAFADDLREPENGGPHALSKSAIGFSAFTDLLQQEGRRVRISRGSLSELRGSDQLTILTPDVYTDLSEGQLYRPWGDVLVVLPKWDAWADFEHPGWVHSDGLEQASQIEHIVAGSPVSVTLGHAPGARDVTLLHKGGASADIRGGRIARLQTMVGASLVPILTDENGHAVLSRLKSYSEDTDEDLETPIPAPEEGRQVFVLSDPDFLNTRGLHSIDTARAGLEIINMLASEDEEIVFDMTLHGMERPRSFLKLLLQPPFLPAVLCLAFAGGLMAVYAAAGRMRVRSGREIALGKATLVENSALLVSLAGRDARMGARYVAMTRALASTAAGVPSRSTEKQRTMMLDAVGRGDRSEPAFSALAADVSEAKTPSIMLKAANRLFRWRQEIGREHRRR